MKPLPISSPTVDRPAMASRRIVAKESSPLSSARCELMRRVAVWLRVSCGNMLAKLGDPRFRSDAWWLPADEMLGFVEIPGGPFMMGSDLARDRWAYRDELPAHPLTIQRFFLQRFPVTQAQFRAFVADVDRSELFAPSDPRCLSGVANHPVAFGRGARHCVTAHG